MSQLCSLPLRNKKPIAKHAIGITYSKYVYAGLPQSIQQNTRCSVIWSDLSLINDSSGNINQLQLGNLG